MKTQFLRSSLFAAVLTVVSLFAFAAETNAQKAVTFEIPFEFQIGEEKYTAGTYTIASNSRSKFSIRDEENKGALFLASTPTGTGDDKETATLVFNRYGKKYFLSKIFLSAHKSGYRLYTSADEKLARKGSGEMLAKNKRQTEQVEIGSKK